MAGEMLGIFCVCAGLAGGVLGLAALLKLAVVLANRMVGTVPEKVQKRGGIAEWDWDDWDDEYASDSLVEAPQRKPAIPEPGIGKCAGVVFLTAFAGALGFVFLRILAEGAGLRPWREDTVIALLILDLPVIFLALAVLLVMTLPASFWRAAMVVFIYGLLLLALGMFFAFVLFALRVIL